MELTPQSLQGGLFQGEALLGPHSGMAVGKRERGNRSRGSPTSTACGGGSYVPLDPALPSPWIPPAAIPGPLAVIPSVSPCRDSQPLAPGATTPPPPAAAPGFPSHPAAPELLPHAQHGHLFVLVSGRLMVLMAHNHFSGVI